MKTMNLKTSSRIALALLACSAALTARGDYPSTVLSQGPVGYWRLQESTPTPPPVLATNIGSLAPSFNATYVGDAPRGLVGPLAGGNGKAVSFDGSSQSIQDAYDPALNPTSFSVEAWLQPKSASVSGGLLCALASMHSASPRSGWLIYQSDPGGVGNGFNFRLYNQNGTATSASVLGASNLTAGVWYHVVGTYDGPSKAAKVYINGVLAGSATATGTGFVPNPDSLFSIGARSDNGFPWPGEAAEVAYYSNAISASTVLAHYQAATTNAAGYGTQVKSDGPIVYYRFLEAAEPIAVNLGSAGAAANGTYIYNAMPGAAGPASGPPSLPGLSTSTVATSFNGSSGYVRIPPLNLNSANVTMTAWVNLQGNLDNVNAGIVFCDSGATEAGLKFDIANNNGLSYDWSSDTAFSFDSGLTIPTTGWAFLSLITYPDHAILAIQDGTSFQFTTNLTTLGALPFSGFTLIGSDGGAAALTFAGSISDVAIFNRSLGLGEVFSEYAAAKGGVAPIVFLDPQAPAGPLFLDDSLTLSVDAGGTPTPTLTYYWQKGGVSVQTGTSSTFSIPSLALSDSGSYNVIVSNTIGTATSASANITVNGEIAPNVVQGPANVTVYQGGTIGLSAIVDGGGNIQYQWTQNGNAISGATRSSFTIASAVATNAGAYRLVATNSSGTTIIGPATVTVIVPVAGSYEASVTGAAPEAWWRLNDSAGPIMKDSMGRHPGYYTNGVTLGVSGLPFGGGATAASFDGENTAAAQTYAAVPYTPILNSEIFTVEAWVQTADQTTEMAVFSSWDSRSGGPYKGKGYHIQRTSGDVFWGGIGLNDQYAYYFITMGANIQNKWTQVAMSFGASGLNFYQDGALSAGGFGDFVRNTSSPFLIGYGIPFIFDWAWNGKIADVSYYTTALTAAQINAQYQAALYGSSTAPVFIIEPAASTIAIVGGSVTLTAQVEGTQPIGLQWLKGTAPIAGATNASLTLANIFFTDATNYVLQATNSVGTNNSTAAAITVLPAPYFVNATNGLVLHLKFDGDSLDYSGRGNNGTNSPNGGTAVAPVYVPGKIGTQAIQLTTQTAGNASGGAVTTASYVDLGQPTDLQFSSNIDFSVTMWVRLPTNAVPGDLPFFGNTITSTGGNGYLMAPSYQTGSWGWSLGSGGNSVRVAGAANAINDGNWHNLIYTFARAGDGITYLDGVQVDVTSDQLPAGSDLDQGVDTVIGQDPTLLYTEPATFTIDDIGVWRRVLTPYEAYAINHIGSLYGNTFDSITRVGLTIQKVSGGYGIIWQAGQLESSPILTTNNASWTPVAGASAPYYQFTPGAGNKFFRVHP
jgi:hypothetical protein